MSKNSDEKNVLAGSSGGLEEMTSKMKFTFSNTDAEGVHSGKEEVDMFHQTERAPMPGSHTYGCNFLVISLYVIDVS